MPLPMTPDYASVGIPFVLILCLIALARRSWKEGSARAPCRANNCAAISPNSVESALFGQVRGAFTGAKRNHPGVFVDADGGTPAPRQGPADSSRRPRRRVPGQPARKRSLTTLSLTLPLYAGGRARGPRRSAHQSGLVRTARAAMSTATPMENYSRLSRAVLGRVERCVDGHVGPGIARQGVR
jgi:hypothetical protein